MWKYYNLITSADAIFYNLLFYFQLQVTSTSPLACTYFRKTKSGWMGDDACYNINESDIVRVLAEPNLKVIGCRIFYEFWNYLFKLHIAEAEMHPLLRSEGAISNLNFKNLLVLYCICWSHCTKLYLNLYHGESRVTTLVVVVNH